MGFPRRLGRRDIVGSLRGCVELVDFDERLGLVQIEVDVSSLSAFSRALTAEIEANLAVLRAALAVEWERGPQFGRSELLGEAVERRGEYGRQLADMKRLYDNLVLGARQLAWGAEQIGAAYAESDQFAKVRAEDVAAVLPPPAAPAEDDAGVSPYVDGSSGSQGAE